MQNVPLLQYVQHVLIHYLKTQQTATGYTAHICLNLVDVLASIQTDI